MNRLKNLKPNQVQVLLERYLHVWIGLRKTGKTTLFRDLVYEKYKDMSAGLLLGLEKGYQALDGLYALDINDWSDLDDTVEELIDNKNSLPYKLIGIDTVDELINMAEQEAIDFYNKKTDTKATTLNEAGGGFNRGKNYTKKLLRDLLNKLLKAGYGVVCIGHSKDKKKKLKDGTEYEVLTCSLTDDYSDIFMDMADIITFLTTEKIINSGVVTGTKVYMNFRNTGEIDCGGRFKGLPDRVEWGAKNYLDVFEKAVKSSMLKPIADKDFDKIKEEQQKQFDAESKKNIEKLKRKPLTEMITYLQDNFINLTDDKKQQIITISQTKGWTDFNTIQEKDYDDMVQIYNIMTK